MRSVVKQAGFLLVFVVAVLLGRLAVLTYVAVTSALAAGEVYRLSRARGYRPEPLVGLLGIGALLYAAHMAGEEAADLFPAIVAGIVVATMVVVMAGRGERRSTRSVAFTLLPVLSIGVLLAHVVLIRGVRDGAALSIVFAVMMAAAEAGAWAVDRYVGAAGARERSAGSVVAGAVAGMIVGLLFPATLGAFDAAIIGAAVGLATSTGELVGAMIENDLLQREPGVRRAPAGVLRRIDGAMLGAPVFFYLLRMLVR